MQLVLQCVEGREQGRRILLRPGQSARLGRTEEADYCFPHDAEMSAVHFSVQFIDRQWRLDDLGSTGGTWINGVRVPKAVLQHADQIRAGGSVFVAQLGGQTMPAIDSARDTSTARQTATVLSEPVPTVADAGDSSGLPIGQGFVSAPVVDLARRAQVGDDAVALANSEDEPGKYLTVLQEQGLLLDAIRFLGQALPRRDLVQWAVRCVRAAEEGTLSAGDDTALQLAEAWAKSPSEDLRRAAHAAAEAQEFGTAASWVAMAAFWSDGSMAPPHAPPVLADPAYAGQAAAGGIMLSAVKGAPEQASEKHRQFVEWGLQAGVRTDNPE